MPELPEVETVRRQLESALTGRTVASVRLSGKKLREPIAASAPRRLRGRSIQGVGRHGKYLLIHLDGGLTMLSHLGMSGRWLFFEEGPVRAQAHVHVRIGFRDGSELWFQDPRRFGLLRLVPSARIGADPALRELGPDPVSGNVAGSSLHALGRRSRISVKVFLMDQRRLAGIGNIYASEILYRAGVDPRRRSSSVTQAQWGAIAEQTRWVLQRAIDRLGTTFRSYRTPGNEPGAYADELMVYDRARQPCRRCGTQIRRIVQGQRSTFFCPQCQGDRSRSRLAAARR